jgi:carbon monoxide dehydrogenase subunit G
MKVSGNATLHGPVDQVYATLHDPAVLVRTIPGCERLEQVGPDAYRMAVTAGVASVKGTYAGEVELTDQDPPNSFLLKASGAGTPGTVSTQVRVRLAGGDDGTTVLTYDADAVVGGPVGGVGQRILAGVARRTAGEFFAAVDSVLTGAASAPAVAGPAAAVGRAAAVGSGAPVAAAPAVFTRPPAPRGTVPGFAAGVALGALAALLGAVVGAAVARRGTR